MSRAASTLPAPLPRLLVALLLGAAGLSALAQTPEAASAAEPAASAAPPVPAAKPQPIARPAVPTFVPPPATWDDLTPTQQGLLAPLARDWATISVSQRSKWLSASRTMATLPPAELVRVQERMRDWARLSPAERVNARIGFQVAKQVDAEQRQAKWEAYQALPPEERQALTDKAVARRQAQAAPRKAAKSMEAKPKSNIVPAAPKLLPPVPVTPGLVQARPGATTVLISRNPTLPQHLLAGEAKVVADPALVDPKTLLPRSAKTPPAPRP